MINAYNEMKKRNKMYRNQNKSLKKMKRNDTMEKMIFV